MSDFLLNVLNLHMGVGKRVRPRIRTMFEPDAPVNSMPQYVSDKVEMETDDHRGGQESTHYATSTIISPANEPATNIMDDCGSIKHQVHDQHMPIIKSVEANGREVTRQRQYNPCSEPASKPISEVSADIGEGIGKRRLITSNHTTVDSSRQESVRQYKNVSKIISPANEAATNTMDDCGSKKRQVRDRHVSIVKSAEANGREVTRQRQYNPCSEPASKPISEVSADIGEGIGKRRLITSNHTAVDSSRQESVRLHKNVHEDMSTACENDMEKSLDDQVQKTLRRLVSPHKHHNSVKTAKADNTAANPNNEGSHNPQSDQHQPTKSELPSGLSGNLTNPEQGMIGVLPGTVYLQNDSLRPQNLLQTTRWLSDRQSELRKGNMSLKDSRVEAEPVTNVTIGRIEVRATPSKEIEQPRRKRKASGVMSLDKYLRTRSRRGNQ